MQRRRTSDWLPFYGSTPRSAPLRSLRCRLVLFRRVEYGPETYGERVADVYDEWYKLGDPAPEAALLAELAAGGRALELGIGTGRVALPLAALGVEVHGVDASPAIVERLRAKSGGNKIPVTI